MRELQISRRLKAVAGFVGKGCVLADVGCDHGYIPIYLRRRTRFEGHSIVNEGPLCGRKAHIREWGLENYIETRLSDGVQALKRGEVQSVVIAGMGGPLMEKILLEGREVLLEISELILQPQSEIAHFRKFLAQQGYRIVQEDMIEEEGKYYPMMKAVHGKMSWKTEVEYVYGGELLRQKHPVLKQYLKGQQQKAEKLLESLQKSETESAKKRTAELQQEIAQRKEALAYYEGE
ncbi:MAG: tRNA (adenine(22)-N(1))-methyltransferase [Blautia hansenii]